MPIDDALEVLSGKWKLQIIIAISAGKSRFLKIERAIAGITSKLLPKELKDPKEHQLIKRTAYTAAPMLAEDTLNEYKAVWNRRFFALNNWVPVIERG